MQIAPDFVYNSADVAKLMNHLMRQGNKSLARSILYNALEMVKKKTEKEPIPVFDAALANASPFLEIKPKRIGGATYQVPREVRGERRQFLAMTWLLGAARAKKGRPMAEKLADEIIAASRNEGEAVRRKENMHRMAEANRAFAHFSW